MRTQLQALEGALAKLPPGWAWCRDPEGIMGKTLTPLAMESVAFEQRAEALLEEATPATATALLDDYERVLGPDPCMVPAADLEARRASVHRRWTGIGGASRAHFVAVAAGLGYAIRIEELRPARAGQMRAGGRCRGRDAQWTWVVHAPPVVLRPFRAGRGRAGDRLLAGGIPALECALRRDAPAHTRLIISYGS